MPGASRWLEARAGAAASRAARATPIPLDTLRVRLMDGLLRVRVRMPCPARCRAHTHLRSEPGDRIARGVQPPSRILGKAPRTKDARPSPRPTPVIDEGSV